ncbi:migration and invasion enhancer 1-like protein [Leptotrombidium deliense]|uniref:Migration and invasion enhancer 1-like protein n=1 Tax=Leptotrombidium deliense TaxID=299467 RepID=A0A443S594_9ACAR|nr:migration and invasion enhancer 1-like protein [Leptotrombidium deliense]
MPAKVQISRCKTCQGILAKTNELNDAIKKKCPTATVEIVDGPTGSFDVKINGAMVYTKPKDGQIPIDEILKKVEEANKK